MQQKVNSVRIKVGSKEVELKDVVMLRGSEGLYVETIEKINLWLDERLQARDCTIDTLTLLSF